MKEFVQKLIHTASQMGRQALELILPTFCAGCGKAKAAFCDLCQETSYKLGAQCLICGFRNRTGKICPSCFKKSLIEVELLSPLKVLWAGRYDGPLKEAIWQFKYKKRKELAKPLAELLWKKCCEQLSTLVLQDLAQRDGASRAIRQQADMRVLQNAATKAVIIPIPLHFKKEYERGFNQAELLAQEFSKFSHLPLLTGTLIKIKETAAQVDVKNKEERIKNLENVFEVHQPPPTPSLLRRGANFFYPLLYKEGQGEVSTLKSRLSGTVILIDDVSTTGATLFHAADALQKAGVKNIIGLIVAHG